MSIFVFPLSMHNNFSEKKCFCLIVWSWHQAASSFFCFYKFYVSIFFTFSMVLPKLEVLLNLKKSFSKSFFAFFLSSVFRSMYGFNQSFLLNLTTQCTFFKTNPWFSACFQFFMFLFFIYHASWLQVFQLYEFTFFLVKTVDRSGPLRIFQGYWISTSRKYPFRMFQGYWISTSRKYPSSLSLL